MHGFVIESRGWYLKGVSAATANGIWTGDVNKANLYDSSEQARAALKNVRGMKREARKAAVIIWVHR